MTDEKMVKVVYEEGETGWAAYLGNDEARIANIPFGDRLNIDDRVALKWLNGRLQVDRVLSRTFHKKTALDYNPPYNETYTKIWPSLQKAGMKVEGVYDGVCVVAHQPDQDPVSVCQQAGVRVRLHETQPDLAEVSPS